MLDNRLFLIFASQDYESANHKTFWKEISSQHGNEVVVLNIAADYVVSTIKKKRYRITESKKGLERKLEHLSVWRPLLFLRPEFVPQYLYSWVAKTFWRQLSENGIDITVFDEIVVLDYTAYWINILNGSKDKIKFIYYLYDEVRYNGDTSELNKKRYRVDKNACIKSDLILSMTAAIRDRRKDLNSNIVVFGNGSSMPQGACICPHKLQRSVAFIGNFRSWIDTELLENLIIERQDLLFVFAGPVESNMTLFFEKIMNGYCNTLYLGKWSKENMKLLYSMIECVIVPYKRNNFMQSTRPIKIVESVLAGTPVVTVPMDGYVECDFIRFARNVDEFSNAIDYVLMNPIMLESKEYLDFCKKNSWENKAQELMHLLAD